MPQGFYVVVDHHSYQERDPNMLNPALFAANWGNLWRTIAELPGYEEHIKGRILPGAGFHMMQRGRALCACVCARAAAVEAVVLHDVHSCRQCRVVSSYLWFCNPQFSVCCDSTKAKEHPAV
jgi:hypothetical protein